jgi:beta-glucosidase
LGDRLRVSVTVTNTGNRPGKEAVLLFTSDLVAATAPDVKRLRRFDKIQLQPREAKVVSFELTTDDLSFVTPQNKRVTELGEVVVRIGTLEQNFFVK